MFTPKRQIRFSIVLLCFLAIGFVLVTHTLLSRNYKISYAEYAVALDQVQGVLPTEWTTIDQAAETEPPSTAKLLKRILHCRDVPLTTEKLQYGKYWLLKNFVRGSMSTHMGCAESITYATNGDYTFFATLPMVVKRWLGPVSFALFTPGYDFMKTMDSIQYARNCLPEADLIRAYVTFHIYFPNDHMPMYVPVNEEEALNWSYDCEGTPVAPYENVNRTEMYKTVKGLTYPINVGRNIARKAVNTYFVFTCDIELYPSRGVITQFLEMVARNATQVLGDGQALRVYPMPVFELVENATIPATKSELVEMLNTKKAFPFHYRLCKKCHYVPDQEGWLRANDSQELELFSFGKRVGRFAFWEPFYISDNREPMFDERVTWEGQSNKRIQGYAMCLMDYEYHVLHPAFLVHHPGIKKFNPKSPRLKFVPAMNKLIQSKIKPEYLILYGNNTSCSV